MIKVTYYLNGKMLEFELEDDKAAQYIALMDGERKAVEREKWRQRKKVSSLDAIEERGFEIADKRVAIEDVYIETDTLREMLQKLTERQRGIIKMHYFEGYTLTEIAAKIGVDKSAVSKQLKRALEKLKSIKNNF